MLSATQGSIWYHFYNVFGMTESGIEPATFRLQGKGSNHLATAAAAPMVEVERTIKSHLPE